MAKKKKTAEYVLASKNPNELRAALAQGHTLSTTAIDEILTIHSYMANIIIDDAIARGATLSAKQKILHDANNAVINSYFAMRKRFIATHAAFYGVGGVAYAGKLANQNGASIKLRGHLPNVIDIFNHGTNFLAGAVIADGIFHIPYLIAQRRVMRQRENGVLENGRQLKYMRNAAKIAAVSGVLLGSTATIYAEIDYPKGERILRANATPAELKELDKVATGGSDPIDIIYGELAVAGIAYTLFRSKTSQLAITEWSDSSSDSVGVSVAKTPAPTYGAISSKRYTAPKGRGI